MIIVSVLFSIFWKQSFAANVLRDQRDRRRLRGLGWRVIVVWECHAAERAAMAKRLGAAVNRHPGG
jgi:DNA mismatch endonuclease (patch repair protein)